MFPLVPTKTNNSICIYLIIYFILDCVTPKPAAASKHKKYNVSLLEANTVHGQTCGPSLAQADIQACFHGPQPASQSFGYSVMFVLEALAALC